MHQFILSALAICARRKMLTRVARCYVYLHTKNPKFGMIWGALDWKMLVNCIAIWIFYGYLEYFSDIW
jgi:hypothetical protein